MLVLSHGLRSGDEDSVDCVDIDDDQGDGDWL